MDTDNRTYRILGFETRQNDFAKRVEKSNQKNLWGNVAFRLWFIDRIYHDVRLEYDQQIHGFYQQYYFDLQVQPLEIYLLCTCIDSMANTKDQNGPLPYSAWLQTKKRPTEQMNRDAKTNLILGTYSQPMSTTDFLKASNDLYEFYMNDYGGLGHNFHELFQTLIDPIKDNLAEAYIVSEETDYPPLNISQSLEIWQNKLLSERITAISKYLWEFRRNKYTHNLEGGRSSNQWIFYEDRRNRPHWVLCKENETWLLRKLIITVCQSSLGYNRDRGFIDRYHKYLEKQVIFRRMSHDLDRNRMWIGFVMDALQNNNNSLFLQIFNQSPLDFFEIESFNIALEHNLFENYDKSFSEWLSAYICAIKALNQLIDHYNQEHPVGSPSFAERRVDSFNFLKLLLENPTYKQHIDNRAVKSTRDNLLIFADNFPSDSP